MILWRISEHDALDGAGGLVVSGRWHSKGARIVYFAEGSALAMLEVLVHLEVETIPPTFQLLEAEAPDEWPFVSPEESLDLASEQATRRWGDDWLKHGATPLARVPSRVAPRAFNWLFNPEHVLASELKLLAARRWPWDARLLRGS